MALIGLAVIVLLVENRRAAPPPATSGLLSFRELLKPSQGGRVILAGGILGALTATDALIFLTLQRKSALPPTLFPLLFVGVAVAYFVLALPLGRLADRIGRHRLFVSGHIAVIAIYLLLLSPWFPPAADHRRRGAARGVLCGDRRRTFCAGDDAIRPAAAFDGAVAGGDGGGTGSRCRRRSVRGALDLVACQWCPRRLRVRADAGDCRALRGCCASIDRGTPLPRRCRYDRAGTPWCLHCCRRRRLRSDGHLARSRGEGRGRDRPSAAGWGRIQATPSQAPVSALSIAGAGCGLQRRCLRGSGRNGRAPIGARPPVPRGPHGRRPRSLPGDPWRDRIRRAHLRQQLRRPRRVAACRRARAASRSRRTGRWQRRRCLSAAIPTPTPPSRRGHRLSTSQPVVSWSRISKPWRCAGMAALSTRLTSTSGALPSCAIPGRFYATLATAGRTYLVRGHADERTLEVVDRDVECPSISPNNQLLAYKHRIRTEASPVQLGNLAARPARPAVAGPSASVIRWMNRSSGSMTSASSTPARQRVSQPPPISG